MTKLTLYTNPQSRGRIAHWMIEELGLAYETVWVNYGPDMKSPEYLSINPMGKVPSLTHNGAVITEVAAICTYLATTFPEQGLFPSDNTQRAAFYRWMFFAAGPLEQATTAKSLGWEAPEGRSAMLGFGSYSDALDCVENALKPGPNICGEKFSAVDVYVGSQLSWGMMFGTVQKRPAFEEYVGRLITRPAFARSTQLSEERIKAVS